MPTYKLISVGARSGDRISRLFDNEDWSECPVCEASTSRLCTVIVSPRSCWHQYSEREADVKRSRKVIQWKVELTSIEYIYIDWSSEFKAQASSSRVADMLTFDRDAWKLIPWAVSRKPQMRHNIYSGSINYYTWQVRCKTPSSFFQLPSNKYDAKLQSPWSNVLPTSRAISWDTINTE